MGRMTRAKANEIAEKMHIDEDAVLDLSTHAQETAKPTTPEPEERPALSDIAPNSGSSKRSDDIDVEDTKPTKGKKGGKKGTKASKKNTNPFGDSTSAPVEEPLEVIPDEIESVPSPASRAASDDLMRDEPELEMSHLPVHDIRPKSPPSSAVRLTRSQLRKAPEAAEPKSLAEEKQVIADANDKANAGILEAEIEGGVDLLDQNQDSAAPDQHEPSCDTEEALPSLNAGDMPNYLQTREDSPMTPSRRHASTPSRSTADGMTSDTSDDQKSYDQLEAAAVEAQTPPRSTKRSDGSISPVDPLTSAVEDKASAPDTQTEVKEKAKTKKSAPVVRTTKASQARISIAHGPKDAPKAPSWGRPSMGASAARRVTSTSSGKNGSSIEEAPVEKKEAVIPHSKPRPISMSFPTPPPPPKSTKAPTKSNFSLPGEQIAAKLKAAREARMAKEAEELEKRKAFKARPAPSATKTPSVRQTSTSKARESLMGGKPLASSTSGPIHKRANSVATTARPAPTMKKSSTPSQTVSIGKRPSTAMATLNKPLSRPSTAGKPVLKPAQARPSSVIARPASTVPGAKSNGTSKGKEVFNRAAQAKSAAEKEKREKEEAAKKARIEAAERGRQASREWAEKQRLRKLGVKPDATKPKENVEPEAAPSAVEA